MQQLPLRLHTYTVAELGDEIRAFLGEAFPGVWVSGEVQRLRPSRNGHLYFELVEKGAGDQIVGRLDAVIWRTDLQRLKKELQSAGQELAEGIAVRCLAGVEFYPPGGRIQLCVRELDALFSLGLLARRRQETLAALAAAGLLEANRALALPPVPLRVGLVTSHGSAAFHDFVTTLRDSGYRFEVTLVHAAVQGPLAEREVASALRAVAALGVDCVVLVRGGGARSDLAAFDSRRIAEAIARLPRPVITGLGHEIDRSVADQVAHTALKTPTMVADFLVRRVEAADRQLAQLAQRLARGGVALVGRERERVGEAHERVLAVGAMLAEERARIDEAARFLAAIARQRLARATERLARTRGALRAGAPRPLERRARQRRELGERLARAGRAELRRVEERCAGIQRLLQQLAPERVLQRGYSITRTEAGTLVRGPGQAPAGTRVRTRVAGGELVSRVERAEIAEER